MADRKRTIDWEDVRHFAAVARHGGLSAAARALGTTHATVSRRIRSLQAVAGVALLERRADGHLLTAAGRRALAAAADMEAAGDALRRAFADDPVHDEPRGLVRVSAPPTLMQHYLASRLAALAAAHPGLDIDLSGEARSVSLDRHECDIAIRFGRPEDGDVITTHLADVGFGWYGTASWARAVAAGGPLAFVAFDDRHAHLGEARWLSTNVARHRIAVRASTQSAQAVAAAGGAGIAMLPHLVGRALDGLVPIDLPPAPPTRALWLVYRGRDRASVPVRAVAAFIEKVCREDAGVLERGADSHGRDAGAVERR